MRLLVSITVLFVMALVACDVAPPIDAGEPSVAAVEAPASLISEVAVADVHIERVDDRRVAVSVATSGPNVSHFFVLDADAPHADFESVSLKSVRLFNAGGTLGVFPADDDQPSFLLTVRPLDDVRAILDRGDEIEGFDVVERESLLLFPRKTVDHVLTGISLAQRAIPASDKFSMVDARDRSNYIVEDGDDVLRPACDPRINHGLTDQLEPERCTGCLSGGPGATACSYETPLTGCSVACAAPANACCNIWGCRCCI